MVIRDVRAVHFRDIRKKVKVYWSLDLHFEIHTVVLQVAKSLKLICA